MDSRHPGGACSPPEKTAPEERGSPSDAPSPPRAPRRPDEDQSISCAEETRDDVSAAGKPGGTPLGGRPGPRRLEELVGPLSFAAKNDFAGLDRVRGLEGLILAKLGDARAEGVVDEPLLDELQRTTVGLDGLPLKEKKLALCKVLAVLNRCLSLPAPLLPYARVGAGDPGRTRASLEKAGSKVGACEAEREASSGASARAVGPTRAVRTGEEAGASFDSVLESPVSSLSGCGPGRAKAFAARGVRTVRDALWFLPVGYERRYRARCIAELRPESRAIVRGRVMCSGERMLGRRRRIFEAFLGDHSGEVRVRYYRSGPWLPRRFREGATLCLSGAVRLGRDRVLEMAHPDIVDPPAAASADGGPDQTGTIVPRYSEIEGVPAKAVREIVGAALPHAGRLLEPLPPVLVKARGLPAPGEALSFLHRPPADTSLDQLEGYGTRSHRRLVYEELFFLQLGLALKARGVKVEPGVAFPVGEEDVAAAVSLLPFTPTAAQLRSIREIGEDMARPEPMHRLLQGDVGSGKTAVAAVALAMAARAGWQGAVMAPTELLAEQHHRTLSDLLDARGIPVVLLSGRLRAAERRAALAAIAEGRASVVVGTQALIQEGVEFRRLGLVVVDEQHRFGVRQRASLMGKGRRPDTLVMTATPIPRTLAMTAYGDLDLSIIDELPPGRTPVTTKVFRARDRDAVWAEVRKHVAAGRQAFVVYPIVETSEHLEDVKAATEMARELDEEVFPDLRVGLVHGRMASVDKEEVMGSFSGGELEILVATTVVEVGIDVPNATVMVVEHAERFGLSQLHQLRGRVGRGAKRSYCYLVAHEVRGEKTRGRLGVMARTSDGFLIAEEDLRLRGPGEVLGTRQSGHPDLLFGNLARDRALLVQARADAFAIVEIDPDLSRTEHEASAREVLARWGGRIQLGRVG